MSRRCCTTCWRRPASSPARATRRSASSTRASEELERFLFVGIDEETRREIGPLPRGHGVLGELIRNPEPLRLPDVTAAPPLLRLPARASADDDLPRGAGHDPRRGVRQPLPDRQGRRRGVRRGRRGVRSSCSPSGRRSRSTTRGSTRACQRRRERARARRARPRGHRRDRARGRRRDRSRAGPRADRQARARAGRRAPRCSCCWTRAASCAWPPPPARSARGVVGTALPLEGTLAGAVLATGSPRARAELSATAGSGLDAIAAGARSAAGRSAGLPGHGPRACWWRSTERTTGRRFDADDEHLLTSFAASAAIAIATAQSVEAERLRHSIRASEARAQALGARAARRDAPGARGAQDDARGGAQGADAERVTRPWSGPSTVWISASAGCRA